MTWFSVGRTSVEETYEFVEIYFCPSCYYTKFLQDSNVNINISELNEVISTNYAWL